MTCLVIIGSVPYCYYYPHPLGDDKRAAFGDIANQVTVICTINRQSGNAVCRLTGVHKPPSSAVLVNNDSPGSQQVAAAEIRPIVDHTDKTKQDNRFLFASPSAPRKISLELIPASELQPATV